MRILSNQISFIADNVKYIILQQQIIHNNHTYNGIKAINTYRIRYNYVKSNCPIVWITAYYGCLSLSVNFLRIERAVSMNCPLFSNVALFLDLNKLTKNTADDTPFV